MSECVELDHYNLYPHLPWKTAQLSKNSNIPFELLWKQDKFKIEIASNRFCFSNSDLQFLLDHSELNWNW